MGKQHDIDELKKDITLLRRRLNVLRKSMRLALDCIENNDIEDKEKLAEIKETCKQGLAICEEEK
jgi:hypothetical protein